jgi:two-component system cell cycle sensor histidine kinase/response regulator CckA
MHTASERPAATPAPHPRPAGLVPTHDPPGIRILHLEDNDLDAALVRKLVTAEWPACQITRVSSRFAYSGELQLRQFDLILSDYTLDSFNGFEALALAQQRVPDTPFILLSGTVGEDRAIDAVRAGARDYVLKDQIKRLTAAIHRALKEDEERERRHQAERHNRELAGFINKAREALIVFDLEARITFWNHGAERLLGWAAADVASQTADRLFGLAAAGPIAHALQATSDHGEWTGEVEVCTKGGQSRLLEFRISLISDDRGRPQARLAICTDITEQKLAERRLREQAEMLDQAREGIIITDLEGRVLYWSAGAERVYGWQSDEAAGKTVDQLFPDEEDMRQLLKARTITLAEGSWHGVVHLSDRLGRPRVIEIRRTLIRDETGKPKAHLSITSDVTEQKRLEEQLLKAQRLENIGLLAAGIAHDLNNMLAPTLMAAPVLRKAVTDPGALRLLDILEKGAERGVALIRQILTFSQGTGGTPELVQIQHLLRDVSMFLAVTFPKSIKVEERFAPDLWPASANPSQIHQVLLNLCINARDAMPQGGNLFLRAENCLLDEAAAAAIEGGRAGAFVVLQVEDTGTGIAPDVLARMWEPFVTTKAVGKGTGLGLSTVRGIIKNHGGFIQLHTGAGRGSSFRIYLPAAGIEDRRLGQAVPATPRGKGELILVVDDERPVRDLIGNMLTRQGYRVLAAGDGIEATSFFAKHANEIRLVVSDLNMPGLDGAMLAHVLKRMNSNVRVLLVSGLDSPGENRPGFRPEEFTGLFLRKPFRAEVLLTKVGELLQPPPRSARAG